MQPTTVVSDGVLMLITFGLTVMLLRQKRSVDRVNGALGIFLTGLAALSGVIRYGWIESLEPTHAFLTAAAGQVGTPLIALSFFHVYSGRLSDKRFWFTTWAVLIALMLVFQMMVPFPNYSIAIGGVSMVGIIAIGFASISRDKQAALLAIAGAAVMMIAGLVIGGEGEWSGFLRLDCFHYAVSLGFLAMGFALSRMNFKSQ